MRSAVLNCIVEADTFNSWLSHAQHPWQCLPCVIMVGSTLEIMYVTLVLLKILCLFQASSGSDHPLAVYVLHLFQICLKAAISYANPGVTLHKLFLYILLSRWENKSRLRSDQGMECNMSSLCFSAVFTEGHLPPWCTRWEHISSHTLALQFYWSFFVNKKHSESLQGFPVSFFSGTWVTALVWKTNCAVLLHYHISSRFCPIPACCLTLWHKSRWGSLARASLNLNLRSSAIALLKHQLSAW